MELAWSLVTITMIIVQIYDSVVGSNDEHLEFLGGVKVH